MEENTKTKRLYVDAGLHAALKTRAAQSRMSLQDYISAVLGQNTLVLDPSLYQQIELIAHERHQSASEYVADLVRRHLRDLRGGNVS